MNAETLTVGLTVHRDAMIMLQAAASVLAQTYRDLVLFIGYNPEQDADGSILEAASNIANMDRRVSIVECFGQTTAYGTWRTLAEQAETKYYAHIDYDDIWLPNKLERQVPLLAEHDVVASRCHYFGESWSVQPPVQDRIEAMFFRFINPVINSSSIFAADDVKHADPKWAESGAWDYRFWVDLLNLGRKFYVVPEPLVLHRIHPASTYNAKGHSDVDLAKIRASVKI